MDWAPVFSGRILNATVPAALALSTTIMPLGTSVKLGLFRAFWMPVNTLRAFRMYSFLNFLGWPCGPTGLFASSSARRRSLPLNRLAVW